MDKPTAISILNKRGSPHHLTSRNTRFANVNKSKTVWWIDIPLDVLEETESVINLVLADSRQNELFHLRVPKLWLKENIAAMSIRKDKRKSAISLELSCKPKNIFQDVRPTSDHLNFEQFNIA